MGKSGAGGTGIIHLLDDPVRIAATVRAAVTDLDPALSYDPELRPGVANLADLLGALTGRSPAVALAGLRGAGALKAAVTEALVETLRPVRERYAGIVADPAPSTAAWPREQRRPPSSQRPPSLPPATRSASSPAPDPHLGNHQAVRLVPSALLTANCPVSKVDATVQQPGRNLRGVAQ